MMRACLVTGATGFIGSHLVDALLQQDWQVRCLVRRPERARSLAALGVEVCRGDLLDDASLTAAVRGVSHVFHVGGLTRAIRPADYYAFNTRATGRLLRACARSGDRIERVVYLSSLAAGGPALRGAPRSELSPDRPVSTYGSSKLRAELLVRAWGQRIPFTILRPPAVYGPRDSDTFMLFRLAKRGLRPRLPSVRRLSLIHVHDLVQGIALAACRPEAIRRTFYVNGHDRDFDEIFHLVAEAIGVVPRDVPVPMALVELAGWLAEGWAGLVNAPSLLDRSKVAELRQAYWLCTSDRITRELGFLPRYTPEEGIARTAEWYRSAGWL
jgi:nucleoside-diphosphate-sugar epimerase